MPSRARIAVQRRSASVALKVTTEVRTRNPQAVEQRVTLVSVNAALAQAGLPEASSMRKARLEPGVLLAPQAEEVSKAASMPSALPKTSGLDLRIVIAAVAGCAGVLVIIGWSVVWCRRRRDGRRLSSVASCDGCAQLAFSSPSLLPVAQSVQGSDKSRGTHREDHASNRGNASWPHTPAPRIAIVPGKLAGLICRRYSVDGNVAGVGLRGYMVPGMVVGKVVCRARPKMR